MILRIYIHLKKCKILVFFSYEYGPLERLIKLEPLRFQVPRHLKQWLHLHFVVRRTINLKSNDVIIIDVIFYYIHFVLLSSVGENIDDPQTRELLII